MFGLIKNQIKTKIGIVLPASYPASRISYENVSVTGDGAKSNTTLLNDLFTLIDPTKVTQNTKIDYTGTIGLLMYSSGTQYVFIAPYFDEVNGRSMSRIFNVKQSGSSYVGQNGEGNIINYSSSVLSSGKTISIYY